MANSQNGQQTSDSIDLIDIVFTAVVAIGLTPEVLQKDHLTGMLSESWVKNALSGKPISFSYTEVLDLGVFLVGLLTLLLSWFGIHVSLRANPIRSTGMSGMFRFVLDVVLILLYGVILIFFRQLNAVLLLLAIVYSLYVVWDVLKTVEYRTSFWSIQVIKQNQIKSLAASLWKKSGRPPNRDWEFWFLAEEAVRQYKRSRAFVGWIVGGFTTFQRQIVSLLFALSFIGLWYRHHTTAWLPIAFALVWTVLYRVAKNYPIVGITLTILSWIPALLLI
jgi:Protein of unknown function (DUF2934)